MSGLFSRHMSVRGETAVMAVFGTAQGVFLRGSWTESGELMRLGAWSMALVALGGIALALLPMRFTRNTWAEESASLIERVPVLAAYLLAMPVAATALFLSPMSETAMGLALIGLGGMSAVMAIGGRRSE